MIVPRPNTLMLIQVSNFFLTLEGIFGTRLSDYVRRYKHPIPLVIVKCSEAIDRAGKCEFFQSHDSLQCLPGIVLPPIDLLFPRLV